jgi:hypothetical protein
MKTIKFLSTFLAVVIAAISTAVEKPKMDVIPLNANQAIVSITNENPALFEMSIETKDGDLVYYKQTTKASTKYKQTFDFADLENGAYLLKLKVNDTRVSREFEVKHREILVKDSEMRFDPYFSFEDDKLKLSYLNFDKGQVDILIYNNDGLFYTKRIGKDFAIQKGFDLSKLENGNYKVVLSSMNNEYEYNLEK